MEFAVEFSTKHDFDYGTRYQNKVVREVEDETTGIVEKSTLYFWGVKKLQGTIDLDLDKYVIQPKEVEIDGKMMTLKQIVGTK